MNYILNHKLRMLGILVLISLLGVGVYLALNPTVFRSRASGAKLILETAGGTSAVTAKVGETVRVYVSVDPGGADVVGVDAVINYNPAMFDVTDADINVNPVNPPSNGFGVFPVKKVESPGKIRISGLAINTNAQALNDPVQSRAAFANIVFHPKKDGVDNMSFAADSVIADRNAQNIFELTNNQGITVTITPAFGAPTNLQVACAYPNATLTWTAPADAAANTTYKVTYNGSTANASGLSHTLDLSTGARENAAVSVESVGGGTLNGVVNCPQAASATPAPVPTLTSSPTSPYTCTVNDAYIIDPNGSGGVAATNLTAGADYNMYIKFNVGGTGNNGDLAYTQYQAIFDNDERINVPGNCSWSAGNQQYTCFWEGNLKAGSPGEHNMRFFVRAVGDETTQCIKGGNPVLVRYTSQ